MRSALRERHKQRLAEAHRARNHRQERRAIAIYKSVLLEDPRNADVALRAAPLLARRGEHFEAWQLYRDAARELIRAKRYKDCLAVYRDACRLIPHEFEAWRSCAELEIKLGREEDAFETLLDGRVQFRDSHTRAQAIALLTRARAIEPTDPEVMFDLSRLYARTDQIDAALELLAGLAGRLRGRGLRRVRALQWRLTLSFRYAYLWLHALCHELLGERTPRDAAEPEADTWNPEQGEALR